MVNRRYYELTFLTFPETCDLLTVGTNKNSCDFCFPFPYLIMNKKVLHVIKIRVNKSKILSHISLNELIWDDYKAEVWHQYIWFVLNTKEMRELSQCLSGSNDSAVLFKFYDVSIWMSFGKSFTNSPKYWWKHTTPSVI